MLLVRHNRLFPELDHLHAIAILKTGPTNLLHHAGHITEVFSMVFFREYEESMADDQSALCDSCSNFSDYRNRYEDPVYSPGTGIFWQT